MFSIFLIFLVRYDLGIGILLAGRWMGGKFIKAYLYDIDEVKNFFLGKGRYYYQLSWQRSISRKNAFSFFFYYYFI